MTDEAPDTIRCPPTFGQADVAVCVGALPVENDERRIVALWPELDDLDELDELDHDA